MRWKGLGGLSPTEIAARTAATNEHQRQAAASQRAGDIPREPAEIAEARKRFEQSLAGKPTEQPAAETGDGKQPATGDTSNFKRALEAVKRSGLWTEDEIASMDRESVRRRGRKLIREKKSSQRLFEQNRKLQTPPSADAKPGQATTPSESGAPQSKVPAVDSDSEGLIESFREQFGDEAAELMKRMFPEKFGPKAATTSQPSTHTAPTGEQPAGVMSEQASDGAAELELLGDLREEFSERYPDLLNDDDFQEVVETMVKLSSLPMFVDLPPEEGMRRALEEALRLNDFEAVGGPAASVERTQRRNGSALTSNARTSAVKNPDPRERGRIKYDYLQAHPGDIAGARRAAGEA